MNSTATANPEDDALLKATPATSDPEVDRPRSRAFRTLFFAAVLIGGGIWGARYGHHLLTHVETDDAYVTGHVHEVSSRIVGTVTEVLVEENQEVKAGDILVRLDPKDAQTKLGQYEALYALAEAKVAQAAAELADSQAKLAQSKAQAQKAQSDFVRAQDLSKTKVVSKQEYDAAQMSTDSAQAGVESSKASANASEAALVAARAQLKVAQTYVDDARLQLSYCNIAAPVSGRAGKRNVEIGQRIQAAQPLFAVVQPEVWVEANFKETQLAKMRLGQQAEITVDALPGHVFRGKIESISPASGAQFALLPPDNATGNFTKVVQRVPVKIVWEAESIRGFEDRLRPGLSTVVSIAVE